MKQGDKSINNWFKMLFCKHEPEDVQALAYVNDVLSSVRNFQICRKCGATSAMVNLHG